MTHHDDYFIPEAVDEQVEGILQMPDAGEAAIPSITSLIQELHAVCEEDAALLERVWERYAAHITAQPAPAAQLSKQAEQKKEHIMHTLEDKNEILSASQPYKRKRRPVSRLMALVNGMAAVLVVSLLVVGSIILFHAHHQTTTGAPVISLKSGMLPPSRCSAFPLDPGEMSLCQSGQFNELDLKGSVDGYTINVIGGYADAGRIFLANKITNKGITSHSVPNSMETLTVQGTDVLGGPSQYQNKTGTSMEGVTFDISNLNIPAAIRSLHLMFKAQLGFFIPDPAHAGQKPSYTPPIVLNFSLPFHAEKRVANLHVSSSIASGEKVTLEHVVVTQSETLLTMQDYNPNGSADILSELGATGGTLTVGTTKVSLDQVAMGAGMGAVGSNQSLGSPYENVRI